MLALSIVLLLIAFRSLLIPLQAAVTNLLCVGAAFGVLVAVFQWGWGLDLVGLSTPYGTVPIASYVPLMMFAALFGLSMDYEVFLVSQIAQHHAAGEPPRQAVRSGVASSAKVIAAAAIIMISVFGSFILNGDPTIKQFGVGPRRRRTGTAPPPDRPASTGPAPSPGPSRRPRSTRRPPPATARSAATTPATADRSSPERYAVDASPGRPWRWSIGIWSPWRWTTFHSPSSRR